MPELNKANRQVCDVDIRILSTMAPFLWLDTANSTTANISGDAVYAMAKGTRRIAFQNPMEGTMTIEAQVYPFKLFALLSDGKIESEAVFAEVKTIKATEAGKLALPAGTGEVISGTVFVYPEDAYGDEDALIEAAYASNSITASGVEKGKTYRVGYMVTRTSGVKKVSFANSKLPQDYYITMKTLEKDDKGNYIPFMITAHKASIQRNFEMAFSSEGDPVSLSLTFDIEEAADGSFMDIVEIQDAE